jgi:hypothetical protein
VSTHVKVLGVLFIAVSAFGVLGALVLMVAFGGAAGLVGAAADPEEAALALPIIGLTGTALIGMLLVLSLPGLVTGFGLLAFRPWARIVGIVLAILQLVNVPIGTILGIYALWVLLNKDTERLFAGALPPATP